MCVCVHADPADVQALTAPLACQLAFNRLYSVPFADIFTPTFIFLRFILYSLSVQSILMKFSRAVLKAFLISFIGGGGDEIESSHIPPFDAAFFFISS